MKLTQKQFDKLKKLDKAIIDEHGREILNPVPAKFPAQLQRPTSTIELMKRVVRQELAISAQKQGFESFEDADDFDVPDDFDVEALTQYEMSDLEEEMVYKTQEQIQQEVDNELKTEPNIEGPTDPIQDGPPSDPAKGGQ